MTNQMIKQDWVDQLYDQLKNINDQKQNSKSSEISLDLTVELNYTVRFDRDEFFDDWPENEATLTDEDMKLEILRVKTQIRDMFESEWQYGFDSDDNMCEAWACSAEVKSVGVM